MNSSIRLNTGFTRKEHGEMSKKRFAYKKAKLEAQKLFKSIFNISAGVYKNGSRWIEYKGLNKAGYSSCIRVNENQSE